MSNQNNALEQAFEGLSFEIQTEIFRPGEKVVAGYLPNKFLVVAKQKAGDDKVTAYIYKPSAEGGEVVFKPVSSHMDGAKGINAALRSAAGITTEKQIINTVQNDHENAANVVGDAIEDIGKIGNRAFQNLPKIPLVYAPR